MEIKAEKTGAAKPRRHAPLTSKQDVKRQADFGEVIFNYLGGSKNITPALLRRTVLEWVEVMDTDQSGNIEKDEFCKFFSEFDELALNDNQLEAMFDAFDLSQDGRVSCDEFAKAIETAFDEYTA